MDTPERGEVRRALDTLKPFLSAYLSQRGVLVGRTQSGSPTKERVQDIHALLKACLSDWDVTLRRELPSVARSYIHELIDIRNRWAHDEPFSSADAARAADTARQLASLIGAPLTSTVVSAPRQSRASVRRETQRDVMIRLYAKNGRNPEATITAYAEAERNGEARRKSNKYGTSAEGYARALFADGEKKGWLNAGGGR